MLLHPSAPLVVGVALVTLITVALVALSPLPGPLARAHGRIDGLDGLSGCATCHHPDGLARGCLSCHGEIAAQLEEERGYHHFLLSGRAPTCAPCHREHHGADFELVNQRSWGAQTPRAFRHPHTTLALEGAHATLDCEACHRDRLAEPLTLSAFPDAVRGKTFLGLGQECISCHLDVHSGGLSGPCDTCHGQVTFRPTDGFDHAVHLPLDGGHTAVRCARCHRIPDPGTPRRPAPFPFHEARGTRCAECHDSPHRAVLGAACESCHERSRPDWSRAAGRLSRETHALTGFRLDPPHDRAACDACHPRRLEFAERYPDPTSPGYDRGEESCEGCHEDAHRGQFAARTPACVGCHRRDGFRPSRFGHEAHAAVFPLDGAHAAVACSECHVEDAAARTIRYAGTPRQCKVCHASPHGDQFAAEVESGDCDGCHSPRRERFRIRPFDHARRTGYALEGAHAAARCEECHVETIDTSREDAVSVRRYRRTPTDCQACHRDVHRGQFGRGEEEGCRRCHDSFVSWSRLRFDHDTDSRFPLEGAHAGVDCSRCHRSVRLADGQTLIQYRPVGRTCVECHDLRSR